MVCFLFFQGSGDPYTYCKIGDIHRSREDFNSAKGWYERSLKIAKEIEDKVAEAIACNRLGFVHNDLGNFEEAICFHKRDLEISKQLEDRPGEGRAHGILGTTHVKLGNYKDAIHHYQRELEIAKEIEDKTAEGRACCNLGDAFQHLGDLKKAVYYYERSLKLCEELGHEKGRTLGNLGCALRQLGDLKKAIDYHERHLIITKESGNKREEGRAYCNIGTAYYNLGDFKTAIDYHERALRIAQEIGNRPGEGEAYCNLGNDYSDLGSFKEAIHYYQLYLTIVKGLGDKAGEGRAYGNLGICYDNLGEIKTAIEYHEFSLKISEEVGDKIGEGSSYGDLGSSYSSLGDFKKAIGCHEQHLKIAKEVGHKAGEAGEYLNLGAAYFSLKKWEQAKENLEDGLNIYRELGNRDGESIVHINLANVYSNIGNFEKALQHYKQSLQIAQELKTRQKEGACHLNIGLVYMKLRDFSKAIEHLTISLQIFKEVGHKDGEAKANYNLGVYCEALGAFPDALCFYKHSKEILDGLRDGLQSEDEWKIGLRHMHQTVYSRLWGVLLKLGKIDEALTAADQGRAQALNDLLESNYGFEDFCSESRPAEETTFDTLSYLPSNTIFIALNEREIFHWVIRKGKVVKFKRQIVCDNPGPDATTFHQSLIKTAREKIGVRSLGRCEDRSFRDGPEDETLADEKPGERECQSSDIQTSDLRTLYDVNIGPITDVIDGDELIIVPEGPLCLAFYGAFMDSSQKYLVESYRIRILPSLNSWRLIANCPEDYHYKSGVLLVGDPCLEKIPKKRRKHLKQLPCAREEVKIIGTMLGTAPLIGEEATKDEVLKRLPEVALIHIAAHGRMETGEIILAPNPTTSPKPKEIDYILTMADVLQAKLRARLVVLSCCHSARGEIKAEGVVGIARSFLGAGARSVLVSLWALEDDATLEFMKRFYRYLTEGQSASEALNRTMNFMRESDKFNKVKHWAPFVLIGDDVKLEFGARE